LPDPETKVRFAWANAGTALKTAATAARPRSVACIIEDSCGWWGGPRRRPLRGGLKYGRVAHHPEAVIVAVALKLSIVAARADANSKELRATGGDRGTGAVRAQVRRLASREQLAVVDGDKGKGPAWAAPARGRNDAGTVVIEQAVQDGGADTAAGEGDRD